MHFGAEGAMAHSDFDDMVSRKPFAVAPKRPVVLGTQFMQQLAGMVGQADFLVTWLTPFAVYMLISLLFAYSFMQLPSLCVLVAAAASCSSILLIVFRRRMRVLLPLGAGCLLATCTGTVAGLFVYDQFACFPAFYANARIYRNVVPSQPSGAVADAGKLTFSSDTTVDANHSVGYMSEAGYTYCVAPVRDKNTAARVVEFWAVGVGCCAPAGGFTCDEADDAAATAGIRIFDNGGFFYDSHQDFYDKARSKAEATYAFVSAPVPMYVRWVREANLDMLSNYYRDKSWATLSLFAFLHLTVSAAMAFAMYVPRNSGAQWNVAA